MASDSKKITTCFGWLERCQIDSDSAVGKRYDTDSLRVPFVSSRMVRLLTRRKRIGVWMMRSRSRFCCFVYQKNFTMAPKVVPKKSLFFFGFWVFFGFKFLTSVFGI